MSVDTLLLNTTPAARSQRLHLGCGRNILPGWINLDARAAPGVDVVADLDACAVGALPFDDDSIDEFFGAHVLEHLRRPLPTMQELHRIARPQARAMFRVPYGSSDDADEDPTHVRRYFPHSFAYFSQPTYHRADYGYRGDWQPVSIKLSVEGARHAGQSYAQVMEAVRTLRNVVVEMTVEMLAVKPARVARADLQSGCAVDLVMI